MVLQLPERIIPSISAYLDLLDRWNKTHALTSLEPEARMEELILDSAALFPLAAELPPGAKLIDFGSGMGIPAVPLALFRPDVEVIALDKAKKKMAFLRQVAVELHLANLKILEGRAEDLPPQAADAGTAKAVGPAGLLASWWVRHGKPGAPFWALKGPSLTPELMPEGWEFQLLPYRLPLKGLRHILEMKRPW